MYTNRAVSNTKETGMGTAIIILAVATGLAVLGGTNMSVAVLSFVAGLALLGAASIASEVDSRGSYRHDYQR
jgi:multisubunit Na+/H+ antiporter MnhG subunit